MRTVTGVTLALLLFSACATRTNVAPPAGRPPLSDQATIDFLEQRVAEDPGDSVAWNRLGNTYLRALRQTGNHDYLDKALHCAEKSLEALQGVQNIGGLLLMARSRQGNHQFALARDLSRQLLDVNPKESEYWALLGDALLELGDYEGAQPAFAKMRELGGETVGSEARAARLAFLHGRNDEARQHFERALTIARSASIQQPEEIAWCEWQLGELAFGRGDYAEASRQFDAAIAAYPQSIAALGAKARVLAAQDDVFGAIAMYERAIALDPVPPFVAAVSDLYRISRNGSKADELMKLIETNASTPREQRLDRRHLALIYADHGVHLQEAYALAKADYAERTDIYAADTLAWTALKAGHIAEAQTAIERAMRLGTLDAKLFYHAGMIAKAAGENEKARALLQRALELNPAFDFAQSKVARNQLRVLSAAPAASG